MTDQEKEDQEAAEAANEYFREQHPHHAENNKNVYSGMSFEDKKEEPKKEPAPDWMVPAGAATGAAAVHTDALRRFLSGVAKPAESVYAPVNVQPRYSAPRAEPAMGGLSSVEFESNVDKIMHSLRGEGQPSGEQKRKGANWKTNREALATEHNLKQPGAGQAIVNAGEMAPTRGGLAVPEHVAYEIEEEELRRRAVEQARREEAAALAKAQAEARSAETAQMRAAAEAKAAQQGKALGVLKGAAKVGLGALGGAFAGKDFYDAYQEYKAKGYSDEMISKLLSGAGGTLMMVPTPFTEVGGAALMGAGMAYPHVAKRLRQ
jgi:hypothetical protein